MHDSLIGLFEHRVNLAGSAPALRHKLDTRWTQLSWRAWWEISERLAAAFLSRGLLPGERVALLSSTRLEWVLADVAIMMAGGVVVPIYPSSTPAQIEQILSDCGATHIIVENPEQLDKLLRGAGATIEALRSIIYIDQDALLEVPDARGRSLVRLSQVDRVDEFTASGILIRFDSFSSLGRRQLAEDAEAVATRRRALGRHDLATLVYTSGTLGEPKGVELTHENLLAEVDALHTLGLFDASDVQLLSLPLAHIFARVTLWAGVAYGFETAIGEDISRLMHNLAEVEPTVFAGVPHIYENVYNRLLTQFEASGEELPDRVTAGLLEQALAISKMEQGSKSLGLVQRLARAILEPTLYQRVRRFFGGRPRFLISGGAPLSPQVAEFLHSCGVLILEGYGLTETSAAITLNTPEDFRFGSVGRPLPGVDITISEGGEILVRGAMCAKGYFGNPTASAALVDEDGWLHTGDLGRFDREGYLYISGRSKNIIVTAGGKNVAPLVIERQLEESPWISHAVLFGDRRHYLTALVTLDEDAIFAWAAREMGQMSLGSLAKHPRVRALVQEQVDRVNATRPGFEAVRRFTILESDFTMEAGELTPTLKLKRASVEAHYRGVIDAMYHSERRAPAPR